MSLSKFLALCVLSATMAHAKDVPVRSFPFTVTQVQSGDVRLIPEIEAMKEISSLTEVVLVGVPDSQGRMVTLDLRRASVIFKPGSVTVDGVKQTDALQPGTSFWSGSVRGLANSEAFLAISPFGTRGWFGTSDMRHHLLAQPVANDWSSTTLRIVDQTTLDAAGPPPTHTCEPRQVPGVTHIAQPNVPQTAAGGPLPNYDAPIVFDTDFEFYQLFGNLAATQTYAQSLIAAISNRYDQEIGVIFSIPYIGFYTTNTDPWNGPSCGDLLDQFRNAWDNGGAPAVGQLYHLISGKNCGGGVAYVNVICNQNFGFGVSGNINGQLPFPPAQGPLTWDFVVVAHEIGHQFSAIHTHEQNPPVDNCGNGNCSSPAGTIMSYCHLCPGGMNNIALTFHPVNQNEMRTATVNSCLQPIGGTNNECAGAVAIVNGTNGPFDNSAATDSPESWPCGGTASKDLWYSYTASGNGDVTITTCGGSTNFDTKLQAFSGTCGNLTSLACNDDSCGLQSSISFTVTGGATYLVRAGGFSGRSGIFDLNVSFVPSGPTNDECAGAVALSLGLNGPFDNSGATNSPEAFPCGFNAGPDLWFSYTAIAPGPVTINTCTPARVVDTVLEVFSGSCGALTSIACNDDTCGLGSQVTFQATPGATYYLHVGGYNGGVGAFELNVFASNDDCAGAIPLTLGVNGLFSNGKATQSAGAFPCGNNSGPDVWFSYTAQGCNGVTVETCTPARSFDTVMEIFDGSCAALTSLTCNDDACGLGSRVSVPSNPGTTYYVRVGGYNGATGDFELVVSEGSGAGGFQTSNTGCGGLGLVPTGGPPVIGSSVGWQLTGVQGAASIWLGLNPINFPFCPGCTIGTTLDIIFGAPTIPPTLIPCDVNLIGGTLYFQGYDLNSAGGCAVPFPFRLSDTVAMTIG